MTSMCPFQWLISLLVCTCGLAQLPTANGQISVDLLAKEELAFQAAAALAAKSVVRIETFGGMERVGDQLVAQGPTTGTIVAADGWIISSLFSFRQQPASILVTLPGGERVPGKIVARDYSRELALLKVDAKLDLPFAVPSDQLLGDVDRLVGQWVIALGKTFDQERASQSIGIVSAVGRAYDRAIQTDAKISPINYGGPLVDLTGRVLGILAPVSPGTFLDGDSSQLYDSGIGFAIPLPDILVRLPRMQKGEDIRSGKLGIVASEQNEMSGPVKVAGAMPGSPAAKAGLQTGDILVEVEGRPIELLAQLRQAIGPVDAGQSLRFKVEREGKRIEMTCRLMDKIPVYQRRYLGLRLEMSALGGLEIVGIEADTPASSSKLRLQQRILTCDGHDLRSLDDLREIVAVAELDRSLQLAVIDQDETRSEILLSATNWPNELPASIPRPDARVLDNMQSTIVDVNLGDFPNRAYALVPPLADRRLLGLLIVFPEPGELDRERAKARWDEFSRRHGWIIAVVNSGNPKRWSMEEVELASRVIGRMQKSYTIDKSRTVLSGLGVGGRVALAAAGGLREKVAAVMIVGTAFKRFAIRSGNSPLRSLDFLLVGDPDGYAGPAEKLEDLGFATIVVPAVGIDPEKLETHPQTQIEFWLEGLSRF